MTGIFMREQTMNSQLPRIWESRQILFSIETRPTRPAPGIRKIRLIYGR